MPKKLWIELGPSLFVGAGILASTFVAVRGPSSGWGWLAGPVLLALAIVGGDGLAFALRGKRWRPSWPALIMAGAGLLACWILAPDPSGLKAFLPLVGASAWVVLQPRHESRRSPCGR